MAAPLAVLVSITVAAVVVVQDWKRIHLHSSSWLVFSALFGIPLGTISKTSTVVTSIVISEQEGFFLDRIQSVGH